MRYTGWIVLIVGFGAAVAACDGGSDGGGATGGGGCPPEGCLIGQVEEGGACVENEPSCATSGGCAQPYCDDIGHYSVTDEIVVDRENGRRLWQRGQLAPGVPFNAAVAYCADLNLGGLTGWRLPTTAEFGQITLKAGGLQGCDREPYCTPAVDQSAFPETEAELYWTRTTYADDINYCKSFCDGRTTPWKELLTAPHLVRCTHDPLP